MASTQISVREFGDTIGMTLSVPGRSFFEVETSELNRPGLQFSGYYEHFSCERVQIVGNAEMTYLWEIEEAVMRERLNRYFSFEPPCVVVARDYQLPGCLVQEAARFSVPVYTSASATTALSHKVVTFLDRVLAPRITRHGVLLDVFGMGIMLMGESGIGKSETSLELVKRGHRLVADDVVEIRRVAEGRLVGTAPELIQHLMEIRGIGIIDVRHMYGVGAVIKEKSLDLIIELEDWVQHKEYDRLGLEERKTAMLDVEIPTLLIPVRPGRNLAIVVEVAARNMGLKRLGYSAAKEFDERLRSQIKSVDEISFSKTNRD